ncbi:hypothetical protein Glove_40g103 [Diversispora epigaea]|uniref:Uncharacterized protein n=1 Tax=Diversispora epigaea TaxID=1348612 RepID=A0A397JPN7_9GLOM|nr:hypothetical protein Glove_40g103 [Diversispora epigaea]
MEINLLSHNIEFILRNNVVPITITTTTTILASQRIYAESQAQNRNASSQSSQTITLFQTLTISDCISYWNQVAECAKSTKQLIILYIQDHYSCMEINLLSHNIEFILRNNVVPITITTTTTILASQRIYAESQAQNRNASSQSSQTITLFQTLTISDCISYWNQVAEWFEKLFLSTETGLSVCPQV